jgi:hypothetical protein
MIVFFKINPSDCPVVFLALRSKGRVTERVFLLEVEGVRSQVFRNWPFFSLHFGSLQALYILQGHPFPGAWSLLSLYYRMYGANRMFN